MANLLQNAAAWFAAKTASHAAATITYRRGATTATLTATVSQTVFRFTDPASGATVRYQSRDFLILAADLVDDFSEPARGDEIDEVDQAGNTHTYRLLPINEEPVWRWNDNARTQYRVHTKLMGTA